MTPREFMAKTCTAVLYRCINQHLSKGLPFRGGHTGTDKRRAIKPREGIHPRRQAAFYFAVEGGFSVPSCECASVTPSSSISGLPLEKSSDTQGRFRVMKDSVRRVNFSSGSGTGGREAALILQTKGRRVCKSQLSEW